MRFVGGTYALLGTLDAIFCASRTQCSLWKMLFEIWMAVAAAPPPRPPPVNVSPRVLKSSRGTADTR